MNNEYQTNTERNLHHKGRVLTGWWDNQPIHRAMTMEEKASAMGIDPLTADFAMALLANHNYKPSV